MTTPTAAERKEARAAALDAQLDYLVAPYASWYEMQEITARSAVIPPYRVRDAIKANVAKTGKVRFKKGLPPVTVDGVANQAYLFWLLHKHATPAGAYLPIDSLMMARSVFDTNLYDRWDRTVDIMAMLDRRRKEAQR